MLRGYRRVIIAAVGFLILAAGPPPRDNTPAKQQQAAEQIDHGLLNIDAPLKQSTKTKVADEPCGQGHYDSNADLCAQWKAADAAASATIATWVFGGLGSLIGGATLVAAILAAKWARRAAEETERSANQGDTDLRPWLDLECSISDATFSADGIAFGLITTATNIGKTPAHRVRIYARTRCINIIREIKGMITRADDPEDLFSGWIVEEGKASVLPNGRFSHGTKRLSIKFDDAAVRRIKKGVVIMFEIDVMVVYAWSGGRGRTGKTLSAIPLSDGAFLNNLPAPGEVVPAEMRLSQVGAGHVS